MFKRLQEKNNKEKGMNDNWHEALKGIRRRGEEQS